MNGRGYWQTEITFIAHFIHKRYTLFKRDTADGRTNLSLEAEKRCDRPFVEEQKRDREHQAAKNSCHFDL
jgi:hypothetical protein